MDEDIRPDDIKLVERYIDGDDYAAEELVAKYQRRIYAVLYRMTGDAEDAKDITQKTFMSAFENIKGFRRESSFHTWIYRIAVNTAINHSKRMDSNTVELNDSLSSGEAGALSGVIRKERELHVKESLKMLPERQKTAVILRAYEGLSLRETAEVMKCTEGAVKAHYHNAIKKLREAIKGKGYEVAA
jgi:RNA polymerase sigma-70 factor (ECF subfamily)